MDNETNTEIFINDEKELVRLGFKRYPEWDFKETDTESFRLKLARNTYRAHINKTNGPVYAKLGVVINNYGIVDVWRDCCSKGSVEYKILLLESEVCDGTNLQ